MMCKVQASTDDGPGELRRKMEPDSLILRHRRRVPAGFVARAKTIAPHYDEAYAGLPRIMLASMLA